MLTFLRQTGAAPGVRPAAATPVENLVAAYQMWLTTERGLVAGSVRWYVGHARKFIAEFDEPVTASLAGRLDATTVTSIVVRNSVGSASVGTAKAFVTAVRSLLRFLLVQDLIPASLTGAVPTVAGWRLRTLPRGLDPEQPQALLAAHDTRTAVVLRDRAVLTVLARLGLR